MARMQSRTAGMVWVARRLRAACAKTTSVDVKGKQ